MMHSDGITRRTIRHDAFWLELERCEGCDKHRAITWHNEEKYRDFEQQVKRSVASASGNTCVVEVNPGPIAKGTRFRRVKFNPNLFQAMRFGPQGPHTTLRYPKLGAFELHFCLGSDRQLVFSKLESGKWPHVEHLVQKLQLVVESMGGWSGDEARTSQFSLAEAVASHFSQCMAALPSISQAGITASSTTLLRLGSQGQQFRDHLGCRSLSSLRAVTMTEKRLEGVTLCRPASAPASSSRGAPQTSSLGLISAKQGRNDTSRLSATGLKRSPASAAVFPMASPFEVGPQSDAAWNGSKSRSRLKESPTQTTDGLDSFGERPLVDVTTASKRNSAQVVIAQDASKHGSHGDMGAHKEEADPVGLVEVQPRKGNESEGKPSEKASDEDATKGSSFTAANPNEEVGIGTKSTDQVAACLDGAVPSGLFRAQDQASENACDVSFEQSPLGSKANENSISIETLRQAIETPTKPQHSEAGTHKFGVASLEEDTSKGQLEEGYGGHASKSDLAEDQASENAYDESFEQSPLGGKANENQISIETLRQAFETQTKPQHSEAGTHKFGVVSLEEDTSKEQLEEGYGGHASKSNLAEDQASENAYDESFEQSPLGSKANENQVSIETLRQAFETQTKPQHSEAGTHKFGVVSLEEDTSKGQLEEGYGGHASKSNLAEDQASENAYDESFEQSPLGSKANENQVSIETLRQAFETQTKPQHSEAGTHKVGVVSLEEDTSKGQLEEGYGEHSRKSNLADDQNSENTYDKSFEQSLLDSKQTEKQLRVDAVSPVAEPQAERDSHEADAQQAPRPLSKQCAEGDIGHRIAARSFGPVDDHAWENSSPNSVDQSLERPLPRDASHATDIQETGSRAGSLHGTNFRREDSEYMVGNSSGSHRSTSSRSSSPLSKKPSLPYSIDDDGQEEGSSD